MFYMMTCIVCLVKCNHTIFFLIFFGLSLISVIHAEAATDYTVVSLDNCDHFSPAIFCLL